MIIFVTTQVTDLWSIWVNMLEVTLYIPGFQYQVFTPNRQQTCFVCMIHLGAIFMS